MGGSESKGQSSSPTLATVDFKEENLKFLRQLDDPKYGQCKVFKTEDLDFQIALVQHIKQKITDEQMSEILSQYHSISQLKHNSILQLIRFSSQKKAKFCSENVIISLFYEYAGNTLENDMKRRQGSGLFYEESELWHIIVSVIAAVAFLASRGVDHGDIQPSCLLLTPSGQIKILSKPIAQTASRLNNYMQAFMGMKKAKYLSPKLLLALEQMNQSPVHDSPKSDAFSLGLTILEAALLQEQDDIYNYEEFQINRHVLSMKLEYVKERYSLQLFEFLSLLLVEDELDRLPINSFFSVIEQLCAEGVEMADSIFSANQNDRIPTYNFSADNGSIQLDQLIDTEQDEIVKRATAAAITSKATNYEDIMLISEQPQKQQYLPSQQTQQREEKVRRSQWTLQENNDNNVYQGSYTNNNNYNTSIPNGNNFSYTPYAGIGSTIVPTTNSNSFSQPYVKSTNEKLEYQKLPSFGRVGEIIPVAQQQQYQQQFQQNSATGGGNERNIHVINDIINKFSQGGAYTEQIPQQ